MEYLKKINPMEVTRKTIIDVSEGIDAAIDSIPSNIRHSVARIADKASMCLIFGIAFLYASTNTDRSFMGFYE